jgi:hypothetical protein
MSKSHSHQQGFGNVHGSHNEVHIETGPVTQHIVNVTNVFQEFPASSSWSLLPAPTLRPNPVPLHLQYLFVATFLVLSSMATGNFYEARQSVFRPHMPFDSTLFHANTKVLPSLGSLLFVAVYCTLRFGMFYTPNQAAGSRRYAAL